ncbi:hypothetical protein N9F53_02525, partial [Bacteroidia bacterium]|nr:hypothetical protein [Bacteroidia bacterium]
GVSDFSSLQAEVYPNPFTTQIRIKAIQPVTAIRFIDISPVLASGQYILEVSYTKGSDRFSIIKSDN